MASPIFDPPLDRHFGSLGLLALLGGLLLGAASLGFGLAGWPVSRLWLYLLGSAMLILVGLQLMISWILMRVLEGLNQREMLVSADLDGRPTGQAGDGSTPGAQCPLCRPVPGAVGLQCDAVAARAATGSGHTRPG